MNIQVYAPVMVTTICRYEKFRKCIESLAHCTDAEKTEVFIGVDYPARDCHWEGYREIVDYLPTIKGFKKVNLFIREENWGQSKNSADLRNRIRQKYDRWISTEDDNEFSPNFLQYMNQCLTKYKDNTRVLTVCGYSYKEWEKSLLNFDKNAFPMKGYCAWGVGNWAYKYDAYLLFRPSAESIVFDKNKVKYLFLEHKHKLIHLLMYRYKGNAADILRACTYSLNCKYSIYPKISKVRNNGFDKSATNCAEIKMYSKQEIDSNIYFNLDDFDIAENEFVRRLHDKHYGKNLLVRVLTKIEYLQWKYTRKAFRDYSLIRYFIKLKVKFLNRKYE